MSLGGDAVQATMPATGAGTLVSRSAAVPKRRTVRPSSAWARVWSWAGRSAGSLDCG
ncbi:MULTISPECIES: hypothetical protein [unclassified Streptomyces]|uniref:hypothetical protein n=1 Tax=unclassified Streptomyces TaxID=2593676 RepID=UPI00344D79AB